MKIVIFGNMKIGHYLFVLFSLLFVLSTSAQNGTIDSLLKISETAKEDTSRLNALIEISNICEEADIKLYSEKAYKLSQKLLSNPDKKIKELAKRRMADACNNIGFAFQTEGEITSAINYYKKSLEVRKEIGDNYGIGESLNNIGYLLEQKGNIPDALENYHESLKHYELAKNKRGMAYALNNIGFIYQKQGDHSKALEYYLKSKKLREEANDKHGISQSLTNIAAIYKLQKNYKEALKTHLQSLEIQKEINDKSGISNSYNNIGFLYENDNDLTNALLYYQKSLEIREELGEKKGTANSLNNIGRLYLLKNDMKKALDCASRSHALSTSLGFPENIRNSSKLLASIYKKQGKYKESTEMLELFFKMHDSLNNESIRKNTAKQQLQYEFGKKAIADSVKHAESEKVKDAQIQLQEGQIKSDRNKRWGLFGGLFLVIVFAVFMYNRVKITQRQKKIIEVQKEIVVEKQKEIVDSINYAKRIQYTLLAHQDLLKQHLPEYFIMFQPKDIVSGDFYWATQKEDMFFLAVCDSTGHGVPGAFMSLLNISFMNEAITEKNILEPNKIFDYVRERLIESVSKDGAQDGMEGILICFDKKNNSITYASSQNVPVLVRNKEIIKLQADKMPIGKGILSDPFKLYAIDAQKDDMLYLYTDGFADQFGGPKGKKFKYNQLNSMLIEQATLQPDEQKEMITSTFGKWKGGMEQVDDVCIIGIRL
ncbi:MAG: tetratricopeptide repeat protein [Bacteroidota bacterium]|nr:tetratricopeptide repeat protein [Bacteroidota bacterium]